MSFYDLQAELPGGKSLQLSELKGKVILIVNVASECLLSTQYKGLQALYEKYKEKDFVILGFPCNQFNGQEPGDDATIGQACSLNYGVTFPLMKKSDVNGANSNDVFKFLKKERPGLFGISQIKWNFEKFLVDREGNVVKRWAPTTSPEAIEPDIAALLLQQARM